jgi:hypothetical protein
MTSSSVVGQLVWRGFETPLLERWGKGEESGEEIRFVQTPDAGLQWNRIEFKKTPTMAFSPVSPISQTVSLSK